MKDLLKTLVGTSGELTVMAVLIAIIVVLNAVFNVAQPIIITLAVLVFLDRQGQRWMTVKKNQSIERCLNVKECANYIKKA